MNRISLFKTRIVIGDKIYLLAKDVRKALGYKSIDQLQSEHSEIVKRIKDLPALVLESDFNTILTSDIDAIKKLKHIEITRVETLRNNTEAIKSIYPLKFIVAGKMFENKARMAGYQSVNEYIEDVDYVNEIKNEKEKLISKRDLIDSISLSRVKLFELINTEVLERNNLQIQQYIHINNCTPYLESFIVGQGIFFSVYDDDYAFDELRVENKDLIIPTYDYEEDDPNKNYGHDPGLRDYREYSCLENILYLITHKDVEDAGVDLLSCNAPGISFYISQAEVIKLLNPNMYRDIVLIDGDMDFAYTKTVTKDALIE